MPSMIILPDDRGSLAYTVSGDGPPIVLVHAGVADHRMWDAVLPFLETGHTVVRGGDHTLVSFPEHVPDLVAWAAS